MIILNMSKKYNNKYFILRHGEARSNKKKIISCWPEKFYNPLTLKGKKEVKKAAGKLKAKKIDLIFASDLLRTKQTAEVAGKELKLKPIYDKRLREYNVGLFNGKTIEEFREFLPTGMKRFKDKPPKGETYFDIQKRIFDFFREIDKKYSQKNILIISHQVPLSLLEANIKKISRREIFNRYLGREEKRIKTGEVRELC
jgi:broad specificity phosphatase PhoE